MNDSQKMADCKKRGCDKVMAGFQVGVIATLIIVGSVWFMMSYMGVSLTNIIIMILILFALLSLWAYFSK